MYSRYEPSHQLAGHDDAIIALAFSPSGLLLASAGVDGKLILWRVEDGKQVNSTCTSHAFCSVIWLDNSTLIAGQINGKLLLMNTDTKRIHWYSVHDKPVECLATNYSGATASGAGGTVLVFTISTMRNLQLRTKCVLEEDSDDPVTVTALRWADAFYPNGLLVAYLYHGVTIWDVETSSRLYNLPLETAAGDAAITPDHAYLVVSNLSNGFDVYELATKLMVKSFKREEKIVPPRRCLPIIFIQEGDLFVSGSSVGLLSISHLSKDEPLDYLPHIGNPPVLCIAQHYNPVVSSSHLACGTAVDDAECYVQLWRAKVEQVPNRRVLLLLCVLCLVTAGAVWAFQSVI